jgi:hypothetical protein
VSPLLRSWQSIDPIGRFAIYLMLASGVLHVPAALWFNMLSSTVPWDSPVSFRKPILFGLSTGLTLASMLIAMRQMRPWPIDRALARIASVSLTLEVALITLQAWLGRASHFHRATAWDRWVETGMHAMIIIATFVVFLLTIRAWMGSSWIAVPPAMVEAQRWGLVFLSISCILGFAISNLGLWNLDHHRSPEVLPPRGVLKFPHGAVLHAIQTLVVIAWLAQWRRSSRARLAVDLAVIAHGLWLVYAVWQTARGRGRWDWDAWSAGLFALVAMVSVGSLALACFCPHPSGNNLAPTQDGDL